MRPGGILALGVGGFSVRPVAERLAALADGERFYSTGKPCRNGHSPKRLTATGYCVACVAAKDARHSQKRGAASKDAGITRYSTGIRCANGHLSDRNARGKCLACLAAAVARWKITHPEYDEAGHARRRRAKDPTSHRAASKRWAQNNREQVNAAMRRWRKLNGERLRPQWRADTANYRARKAGNGGNFTADDVVEIHKRQKGRCASCRCHLDEFEIDHIHPVVLGGTSDPANLQLLCMPCNRSKGGKHPIAWAQSKGLLL